jgi:hypothetical protein
MALTTHPYLVLWLNKNYTCTFISPLELRGLV